MLLVYIDEIMPFFLIKSLIIIKLWGFFKVGGNRK